MQVRRLPWAASLAALVAAPAVAVAAAQQTGQQTGQQQTNPQIGQQQQQRQAGQPQRAEQRQTRQKRTDIATGLQQRQPAAQIRGQRPVQVALVTSPDRISSNPEQFYGVPVSVHAQVGEVTSPSVFTLEQDAWWSWGDNLMVIVPNPAGRSVLVDSNDFVTVVGTVRPWIRAEMERDYDWFDDFPDLNIEFDGRPVIVADMARTSDGVNLTQDAGNVTRLLVADAGDIAEVPGRFYGSTVSVRAEVEDAWSPRVFTLDEDEWFAGPDVLVFNPFPAPAGGAFQELEGDWVTVIGTVRPFVVADFERDYEWFDAADYQAFNLSEFEMRPAVVASSILGNNREFVQFQPALSLDVAETGLADRTRQWRDAEARRTRPGQTAQRTAPGQQRATEQRAGQQPQPGMNQPTGTAGRQADQPAGTAGQAPGTQGGQQQPRQQQPGGQQQARANQITDIGQLTDARAEDVMNRPVRLTRARVLRAIDDRSFLIGASEDRAVMVRVPQGQGQRLTAGQSVRLEGTVQPTPAGAPFQQRPYYIEASTFGLVE